MALAVGFGVANGRPRNTKNIARTDVATGYVTFNPAFQDLQVEKLKKQE